MDVWPYFKIRNNDIWYKEGVTSMADKCRGSETEMVWMCEDDVHICVRD